MHMADALVSPAVGGVMWAATAAASYYSVKSSTRSLVEQGAPLMGVLGAFVFAAQMINFAIPGTGSSGHLGGGMLLSVLLGSRAAFLCLASILAIQALLFADGGLLAYGCNVFNLAFFPCFIAYPLIYKPLIGENPSRFRLGWVVTLSAVFGLQLGAMGVVLQTVFSGISVLPFAAFLWFMLPIHLAIGLVEGAVTAAVLWFIQKEAPEMVSAMASSNQNKNNKPTAVMVSLLIIALLGAGVFASFASDNPDGLEWSILKVAGTTELNGESPVHAWFKVFQEKTALFPDYQAGEKEGGEKKEGLSGSGLVGVVVTLIFTGLLGVGFRILSRR